MALLLGALLVGGCATGADSRENTKAPTRLAISPPAQSGALVVVGGGAIPDSIRSRFLELAGGPEAPLLIFPQASRRENAGAGHRSAWEEHGAQNVMIADLTDPDRLAGDLEAARAIWFGGGSQNRLMEALIEAGCIEALRRRHAEGCVIGGTSAGAAVMSTRMITGEAATDRLESGATELGAGLGLWPGVIVDQHFLRRERFIRLYSAVLDHYELVGVGIDEGTAVVVAGGEWEVIGESTVLVIDPREAQIVAGDGPGNRGIEARDVRVHALSTGARFAGAGAGGSP